ncbi:hypothetical protein BJY00DRAFT_287587 [Aspergillus carlsbadensis]|nr:hypothetical protein BJY00DRAFT_287587 [Aspergillus carlsbadensis]
MLRSGCWFWVFSFVVGVVVVIVIMAVLLLSTHWADLSSSLFTSPECHPVIPPLFPTGATAKDSICLVPKSTNPSNRRLTQDSFSNGLIPSRKPSAHRDQPGLRRRMLSRGKPVAFRGHTPGHLHGLGTALLVPFEICTCASAVGRSKANAAIVGNTDATR